MTWLVYEWPIDHVQKSRIHHSCDMSVKLMECSSWNQLTGSGSKKRFHTYRHSFSLDLASQMLPLYLGKSKKSLDIIFIYFRLFTLSQKKTNSNCCTAALAVYLLLFSASYYLHSPSSASGTRYRRSMCIDMDILWQWLVTTWAEFQYSMVYTATDQCWKRVEACINAEGGHAAVTLLAWHSSCHTSQLVLIRATIDNPQLVLFTASNIWKKATNLQSDEKVLHFTS